MKTQNLKTLIVKYLSVSVICLYCASSSCLGITTKDQFNLLSSYMKNNQDLAIDFTQQDSATNESCEATLIILSNKNFRVNYYYPCPLLITGNHKYLYIYDFEMNSLINLNSQEYSNIFFISSYDEFIKNFDVIKFTSGKKYDLFVLSDKQIDTILTLQFNKKTKKIHNIKIQETPKNIININVVNTVKIKHPLAEHLFKIQNPDFFGVPERLNKQMLKKQYIK